MAQYMLNNKYTFFDNKDKNTNTIKLLINNDFSPNKFHISTENSHNHYDKPSLEDKDKEKEKDNHKKEIGRKVLKKKFIKKVTNKERKLPKENKPLKQNNKNKALKLIKQKDNAEKKPLNKKVKAIKKRTTSKQQKVTINEEKLDPKDIKTGWWDQ